MGNHIAHNGSGYADPTLDAVLKHEKADEERYTEDQKYHSMANHIRKVLENNGYKLEGPISLINIESGRKRRIY